MQNNPTVIFVAAAALIAPDHRVLMQRRRSDRSHGGLWEFPGGKLEAGETPSDAVVREIREELGVELDIAALQPSGFAERPAALPAAPKPLVILLYSCRSWQGEPRPLDAAEVAWFAAHELHRLAMPPLDYPLAKALQKLI